jgi:hypothetical protein
MSFDMRIPRPGLVLALTAVLALAAAEGASARPKKQRTQPPAAPAITQYEHGTPVIMQGLEWPKAPARIDDPQERAERRRTLPRGSGAYLPPVPSPSPPSLVPVRPLAPYTPPPINSFSDRVTQCNLSFPLNAGLGNNPGTRDAYVRYCANN